MSIQISSAASKTQAEKIGPEIIEHWYKLVAAQQFSSKEFYDHIEEGIKAQQVPALEISRVDLAEGGLLSDKREYLRMKREHLIFDVCAAPIGVNYFFSYRFYLEPAVVEIWELVAFVLGTLVFYGLFIRVAGLISGTLLAAISFTVFVYVMRNAIGLGMRDFDASIMKLPVLGPIYERFFRKDTYYRQDVRLAYCVIVSAIVKNEVDAITASKGVQLYREFMYSPVFEGLYRQKEVALSPTREAVTSNT